MPHQLRLLISVFVSGAVVMGLELLGSRLLAPVFGNSIFVWGSLIGVVLAALSAGYYSGGKLADRKPDFQVLSIVIFAAGLLVIALPALAPPIFDFIVKLDLGDRYSPLLATTALLGPPSLLLGTVSPYAIRLAAKTFEKLGKASGNLYALSTLGSIVGTFVTVFVLIPEFGVNKIIFALGVTLLVVAFLGLGFRMKVFVLLVLLVLPFAAPYMVSRRLTIASYTLALGDTIYETDTPYHHLLVADSYDPAHQSYVRYLILDDNLHSAMDLNHPERTVFDYTDYFQMGFLLNPNITRVLFIGGGGFTGPKAFLKDYPKVSVDVAEIDPEVIRVAEQYFAVNASNPRLHIYSEDGRVFLQQTAQKYDLVVLDAYSKSYVPFHMMTAEFFKEVARHLTGDGSVISNLIAGISGAPAQLLTAEVRTMGTVFPNVYVFPVRGPDYQDPQNVIILATLLSTPLTKVDFTNLATRTTTSQIAALKDDMANYFTIETSNAPILTDNFAPVETLPNPLTGQSLTKDEAPICRLA
jgi:spermidine synthase